MRQQFRQAIDQNIGRIFDESVTAETVSYAANPGTGIAPGLYVDLGISNYHALRGGGAKFAQDSLDANRIRFLAFETIAAVNKSKVIRHAQSLQYFAAGSYGF